MSSLNGLAKTLKFYLKCECTELDMKLDDNIEIQ